MKTKTYNASCYCQKVKFSFKSDTAAPFLICYCSICRKCNGSGGFGINIMCQSEDFEIESGKQYLKKFVAKENPKDRTKELHRHFCTECASHLWIESGAWPEHKYPYAGCVDDKLPVPPSRTSLMENYKREWVPEVSIQEHFDEYPDEKNWIVNWHKRFESDLKKQQEKDSE